MNYEVRTQCQARLAEGGGRERGYARLELSNCPAVKVTQATGGCKTKDLGNERVSHFQMRHVVFSFSFAFFLHFSLQFFCLRCKCKSCSKRYKHYAFV